MKRILLGLVFLIFFSSSFAFAWELEKKYGKECKKHKKDSNEYDQCIIDKAIFDIQVKIAMENALKLEKYQKAKELEDKLSKMTPDEQVAQHFL
jgi:predicted RND superfamily exporter protein